MENRKELKGRFMKKTENGFIPIPTIQEINESELKFQIRTEPVIVKLKALTVNQCWQGKRFKTPEYKTYEKHMLLLLPKIKVPDGKLKVIYEFGVSNMQADYDNLIKPFQDILQKKYWFNDANIWEAEIKKVKVKVGEEYCKFEFISINNK